MVYCFTQDTGLIFLIYSSILVLQKTCLALLRLHYQSSKCHFWSSLFWCKIKLNQKFCISYAGKSFNLMNRINSDWRQNENLPIAYTDYTNFQILMISACNAASPATSNMAVSAPKNGRQGLERAITIGYLALQSTLHE